MLLAVLFFRSFYGSSEPGTPSHRDSIPSKPWSMKTISSSSRIRGQGSPSNILESLHDFVVRNLQDKRETTLQPYGSNYVFPSSKPTVASPAVRLLQKKEHLQNDFLLRVYLMMTHPTTQCSAACSEVSTRVKFPIWLLTHGRVI
jgi:hypothetical protein